MPQYLNNACSIVVDWSKDRGDGEKVENIFYDTPNVTNNSWTMAYEFVYQSGQAVIQKGKSVFIVSRKEHKSFIIPLFVNGKYDLIKSDFDAFIEYFKKVRLVKLNTENWAKSSCTCGWYLKNYSCYHLIAVATKQNLIEIPLDSRKLVSKLSQWWAKAKIFQSFTKIEIILKNTCT